MPLETVTPEKADWTVKSVSSRYSEPLASVSVWLMLPAQKRPAGSHLPSFIRLTSLPPSGSAITSTSAVPVAIETSANPSPVAATSPPRSRIATADTPHSIATEISVPVRGSNR